MEKKSLMERKKNHQTYNPPLLKDVEKWRYMNRLCKRIAKVLS